MYHQDLAIQLISAPDQRATLGGPPYAPGQRMHWIRESQNGPPTLGPEIHIPTLQIAKQHQAHL